MFGLLRNVLSQLTSVPKLLFGGRGCFSALSLQPQRNERLRDIVVGHENIFSYNNRIYKTTAH